jgi:hypothetical protein
LAALLLASLLVLPASAHAEAPPAQAVVYYLQADGTLTPAPGGVYASTLAAGSYAFDAPPAPAAYTLEPGATLQLPRDYLLQGPVTATLYLDGIAIGQGSAGGVTSIGGSVAVISLSNGVDPVAKGSTLALTLSVPPGLVPDGPSSLVGGLVGGVVGLVDGSANPPPPQLVLVTSPAGTAGPEGTGSPQGATPSSGGSGAASGTPATQPNGPASLAATAAAGFEAGSALLATALATMGPAGLGLLLLLAISGILLLPAARMHGFASRGRRIACWLFALAGETILVAALSLGWLAQSPAPIWAGVLVGGLLAAVALVARPWRSSGILGARHTLRRWHALAVVRRTGSIVGYAFLVAILLEASLVAPWWAAATWPSLLIVPAFCIGLLVVGGIMEMDGANRFAGLLPTESDRASTPREASAIQQGNAIAAGTPAPWTAIPPDAAEEFVWVDPASASAPESAPTPGAPSPTAPIAATATEAPPGIPSSAVPNPTAGHEKPIRVQQLIDARGWKRASRPHPEAVDAAIHRWHRHSQGDN